MVNISLNPDPRRCPHCKCEMECVDDERGAYFCELCLHEEDDDQEAEPRIFKSRTALRKWERKRRKVIKAAAAAHRAAMNGGYRGRRRK